MERLTKRTENDDAYFKRKCFDEGVLDASMVANRLAELEDKIESGELLEQRTEPLTIEELKNLQVGDWVWIVNYLNVCPLSSYYRKSTQALCEEFFCVYDKSCDTFNYANYGTKWLAYKNKEQAETRLKELQEGNE